MTVKNIISKLKSWSRVNPISTKEKADFALIISEIECLLDVSANGKEEVKRLESLEELIWMASEVYHKNNEYGF